MSTVMAIDLGGTKLSAGLLDAAGRLLASCSEPTTTGGRESLLAQLARVAQRLTAGRSDVLAMGLGTPGLVDTERGIVVKVTNLVGWSETHARSELQRLTGLPVAVANDANLAAVGEAWQGAGRGKRSFVMLTLGTGVGGAIYDRAGGAWQGSSYRGGEFGHSILYPGGRPCACGQLGCVEQYLSGRSLQSAYRHAGGLELSSEQIFRSARQGEELACQIVSAFARDLALHLVSLQNILDPELVIIGGGLAAAAAVWGPLLDRELGRLAAKEMRVNWRLAETGNMAGLFGAGRLAFDLVGGQSDA